jgi:hypothetical protein
VPDEDLPAEPRDAQHNDAREEPVRRTEPDEPTEGVRFHDAQPDETPGEPSREPEAALAAAMDLGPEIEAELTEERDDRVSPLILSAAVIGMLVGLFVWGSLAMSVMSSTEGLITDLSTGSEGSPAAFEGQVDCDALDQEDTLSPAQAEAYAEQCDAAESDADASSPADPALNRADCDAIRGTDYRSPEEREWFLENCVEG